MKKLKSIILKGYNIFLADAIGAFISILLLSLVYLFAEFFGMPKNVILIFIGIASVPFIYSTTTFFSRPIHWQFHLGIIAFLNMSYCLYTGYQIFKNSETLSLYGYIYFSGEILLILILSIYELKHALKSLAR
jgi:hypothetical protein